MSKRLKDIHATEGESLLIANNWTAEAEKRGTTVSTSTWTYSGAGTLSGASLTVAKSAVNLAPTCHGVLTNTVTLANGETLMAERVVSVKHLCGGNLTA
jgi:hypothetical protein